MFCMTISVRSSSSLIVHDFSYKKLYSNLKFISQYTTLIKQPRFGNLSKSLPIVHMKNLSEDSDLAPKL